MKRMNSVPCVAFVGLLVLVEATGVLPRTEAVSQQRMVHSDDSALSVQNRFPKACSLLRVAIEEGLIPGAVLAVGDGQSPTGFKAYMHSVGHQSVRPGPEIMVPNAVFDLASLTKPVATATAVMILAQRGVLELDERASHYLPSFGNRGKEDVTLNHLLRHTSGLTPDNALADYWDGRSQAFERIDALPLLSVPGVQFRYSDVGYLVLGRLIETVDGRALDQFCKEEIFEVLGMGDTCFNPGIALQQRCVPTEPWQGQMLRGRVHDPRARALGGVAGHAGLFSTAQDLSRWCRMLLGGGSYAGRRVLEASSVDQMLRIEWLSDGTGGRTAGLDGETAYSSPRGDHFPSGRSVGHSGFTGTSLWMDPGSGSFVILLTSRLHKLLDDSPSTSVVALRREVATAIGSVLSKAPLTSGVFCGIDVLARESCQRLRGQRVGLLTHAAGRTRDGMSAVDLLGSAEGVELVRVFTPEHGLDSNQEGSVADARDGTWGVPIVSLYGENRWPRPEDLDDLDTVVVDLQDVGVRIYTYATTLAYMLETCAETGTRVLLLDRPNPLAFLGARGPSTDPDRRCFISYQSIPLLHGLTLGEMSRYFCARRNLDVDLDVLACEGWARNMEFADCGLAWRNPSPNLRNPSQALLYPMVGLLEACNLSVGRGCDQPFELLGAPWIHGPRLARAIQAMGLPGVRVSAVEFTPDSSVYAGQLCEGLWLQVSDSNEYEPVVAGLAVAWQLERLYSREFEIQGVLRRLLHFESWQALRRTQDPLGLGSEWASSAEAYWESCSPYLIYPPVLPVAGGPTVKGRR